MRALAIVLGLVFVGPAAADDKPAPAPQPKSEACPKKVFVGKGLDRKAVCVIEAPVVVKAAAPKPQVTIVPTDGRAVTGRPKSDDRLRGLGPHTR
ncbi:MAG: hypothetical protein KF773_06345 [Deltaproteobacteria bacterium]|nr:hypothetical protein [Deltaproteobacteria bacterium]MCW5805568.1 hypothetical protein [Deltaproteobacteria bacterium]